MGEGLANISVIIETGNNENWQQILIKRKRGKELFTIEKNIVAAASLGAQEIQEFISEIKHAKPTSAAKWLINYLPKVRVIYAFQILFRGNRDDDWKTLHTLHNKIRETVGGIYQADREGFSNREGYHILWQFSDRAKGIHDMAVLNMLGNWRTFEMDLGNLEHRKAFLEGKVPKGVKTVRKITSD